VVEVIMEPVNPDSFYIMTYTDEIEGRKGKVRVKVWVDEDGKRQEKIISFEGV
jgi:hypothetical protein